MNNPRDNFTRPRSLQFICPLLAALLLLPFSLVAAESPACSMTLDEVLAEYAAARGGAQAIESQHALRIQSTNHEGKWNPIFDYRVMKPGYMWIQATYDDGEVIFEGYDGERGWEKWGEKPAEYVSGDAGKALNQGAMSPVHLYGLHHMEGLGAKVTLKGCETVGIENFYVLRVLSAFGTDIDYYLNGKTFWLERSRTTRPLHPTVDPTPIVIEERWSDFRFVEGVLHPFRLEQWNLQENSRLSWLEIASMERFTDATPAFFGKPD